MNALQEYRTLSPSAQFDLFMQALAIASGESRLLPEPLHLAAAIAQWQHVSLALQQRAVQVVNH